jgi:hypothetical protein
LSAYPGSFPAFAAADSVGLLARRHCAAQPSRPGIGDSGSRGISSALQSRGGDGFAPSSRHGVSGGCGGGLRHPVPHAGWNAAILRVNDLAERPGKRALRNNDFQLQLYVSSSLRRARKFTRGRPAGPSSTSSGASKTCSSNSRWYTAAGGPTRRQRPCCSNTT